ncbi:hypothetical protein Unana1_05667 [Umbelopsis nana]
MSANIKAHNRRENETFEFRRGQASPVNSRTIPTESPSASRAAMRRFQLEPDMRRESLAFFRKLDHGHADVSYDLLSNEWNDMMNDPLIDHDADSPIPKHPPKRSHEKFPPYRRANALNATPLRQSIPMAKSSPFAPSPKMVFETELDDTLEMDTVGPPALSEGSLKAMENLSPMQPPRAKFEFNEPNTISHEDRPSRITIPSHSSSLFHLGSPSNRKNRVIVAPTAMRSPERPRKQLLSPSRLNKLSPQKSFPRSTLGTPPKYQGFSAPMSPVKSHTSAINYYPITPTRHSVNIAATPSRIHEYKPLDSQEEDTALSPPKLDFEGVLASCNSDNAAERQSDDDLPTSSQEKTVHSSQPSQESQLQDFIKLASSISADAVHEHTSDTGEIPLSPSERVNDSTQSGDEQVGLHSSPSRRQFSGRNNAVEKTYEAASPVTKSEPVTPQKLVRQEDPGSNSSIKRVKDFWESLAVSSAERLASVKRSLDVWSPTKRKQHSNTSSPLKRRNSSLEGEQEEASKWRKLSDTPDRNGVSTEDDRSKESEQIHVDPKEKSPGSDLYSNLNNVKDHKVGQGDESADKENWVKEWTSLRSSVTNLPSFKKTDSPVARRRTENFRKLITPERSVDKQPASKSVEARNVVNDLIASRNLLDELKSQPLPLVRSFSDRRTSRFLLEVLGSSKDTSTSSAGDEIIRKRGDFKANRDMFDEESPSRLNVKSSDRVTKSSEQETLPAGTLTSPSSGRSYRSHDTSSRSSPLKTTTFSKSAEGIDDHDWLKPSISNLHQDSGANHFTSPVRPESISQHEDRWNAFVSPKRPIKPAVAETPIPQTPKSAMLFAERKLTRGSGLDYASLPTPAKPTVSTKSVQSREAKYRAEPALSAPSRLSPKVHRSSPDHLVGTEQERRESNAEYKPVTAEREEVVLSTEKTTAIEIEPPIRNSIDERSSQNNDQLSKQDYDQQLSNLALAVSKALPGNISAQAVTPNSSETPAKRKREEDMVEPRHRRKVRVNPIPVSQRPSRIPIATWRIKKQQQP